MNEQEKLRPWVLGFTNHLMETLLEQQNQSRSETWDRLLSLSSHTNTSTLSLSLIPFRITFFFLSGNSDVNLSWGSLTTGRHALVPKLGAWEDRAAMKGLHEYLTNRSSLVSSESGRVLSPQYDRWHTGDTGHTIIQCQLLLMSLEMAPLSRVRGGCQCSQYSGAILGIVMLGQKCSICDILFSKPQWRLWKMAAHSPDLAGISLTGQREYGPWMIKD